MSLILLTSAAGAPGVSTAALGLALSWGRASLLVEAAVEQSLLAGYFGGTLAPEPNLGQIAALASRGEAHLQELVWQIAKRFPSDAEPNRRLFISGPNPPWVRGTVDQRWDTIAAALERLDEAGMDTLIDFGRLPTPMSQTPTLVPPALMEHAAVVGLMLEPTLPGIAAARVLAEGLALQAKHSVRQPVFGLVLREPASAPARLGRGAAGMQTYTAREISAQLKVPVLGAVPHDVVGAARLNQGQDWHKSPLARGLQGLSRELQRAATQKMDTIGVLDD